MIPSLFNASILLVKAKLKISSLEREISELKDFKDKALPVIHLYAQRESWGFTGSIKDGERNIRYYSEIISHDKYGIGFPRYGYSHYYGGKAARDFLRSMNQLKEESNESKRSIFEK